VVTRVCVECFGDRGLQRRIEDVRPQFPNEPCDLHANRKGVPVVAVAGILDEVVRGNYAATDDSWDEGEDLESLVYELTEADEHEVVRALIDSLIDQDDYDPRDGGEPFYQEDFSYAPSEYALEAHSGLWDDFREQIQHQQRFFNTAAKGLLKEIFEGLHLQRDDARQGAVYQISPGDPQSTFYRARIADALDERDKIRRDVAGLLGPPPARRRKPGRMNPSGICTFYGAFAMPTCIAELRPNVGSYVIGARFDLIEPLTVLDTTCFSGAPKPLSLFAKDHIRRMGQWRFMRRFMQEIAQPISPRDVHLDYIPTQAVAEYLVHHHEFTLKRRKVKIEAIIYQSAQHPAGKNMAILGEASTVGLVEDEQPLPSSSSITRPASFPSTDSPLVPADPFEPDRIRIRAQPDTLEIHRILGADYSSHPHLDVTVLRARDE